jgi:hypothetical protein
MYCSRMLCIGCTTISILRTALLFEEKGELCLPTLVSALIRSWCFLASPPPFSLSLCPTALLSPPYPFPSVNGKPGLLATVNYSEPYGGVSVDMYDRTLDGSVSVSRPGGKGTRRDPSLFHRTAPICFSFLPFPGSYLGNRREFISGKKRGAVPVHEASAPSSFYVLNTPGMVSPGP